MDTSFDHYLAQHGRLSPLTRLVYAHHLNRFGAWCDAEGVAHAHATTSDVLRFITDLREEGLARSTISQTVASVRRYFKWLEEAGAVETSPMRGVTPEKVELAAPRAIDVDDLRRLLDVTAERKSWSIIAILAFCSLRPTELLECKVSSLDTRDGETLLHFKPRAKATRLPYVALVPEVAEATFAQLEGRTRGPLFVERGGKQMTRFSVQTLLNTASRRAGLDYVVSSQMLTYALPSVALQHGFSLPGIMKAVGVIQPGHVAKWQVAAATTPGEQNATVRFARMVLDPPDSVDNWLLHAEALLNESELPEPFAVIAAGAILEGHLRKLCGQTGMNVTYQESKNNRSSIDKYAAHLLSKRVLTAAEKDRVGYLGKLRNDAAHGWFGEVAPGTGGRVLRDVRDLVVRHPAVDSE